MKGPVKLTLVGISHHRAPIELRERVAFDLDACRALAERLGAESVVLSTCNRTELYVHGGDDAEQRAVDALTAGANGTRDQLTAALYRLSGPAAELHLFRVAAGLDSSVPGEGEILGQVRAALEAGMPGPYLMRVFRQALRVGRRVRVETSIGESPASVPSAAAALAQGLLGDLAGRQVLLLGAGKMSESTARILSARGAVIAAVANRTLENGEELARKNGARSIELEAVAQHLSGVDIVVSSTSAPGFVLARDAVSAALAGVPERPLLFLDLAVPRDIDPAIAGLGGCVVRNIDDLESVVAATIRDRRQQAAHAEYLVAAEAARFRAAEASLGAVPTIVSLRAHADEIKERELERLCGHLPADERRHAELVASKIVAKLLHLPTVRMKEAAATAEGPVLDEAVRHLFGLGDEPR